jgi:hypothetical protein
LRVCAIGSGEGRWCLAARHAWSSFGCAGGFECEASERPKYGV